MRICRKFIGLLLATAILAFVGNGAQAASFIVEDGKANAEIITSSEPTRSVKIAAEELQLFIKKISGAELTILNKPSADSNIKIYLGESEYTKKLGLLDKEYKNDSYRIASGKDYLAFVGNDKNREKHPLYPKDNDDVKRAIAEWNKISGGLWKLPFSIHRGRIRKRSFNKIGIYSSDRKGTLYGVYDFLRSLGVRWYFPGEFGECVPEMKSIELPEINKTVTPDFSMRIMGGGDYCYSKISRDQCLWNLRLGLGSTAGLNGMHGVDHILRPKKTIEEHPEWFLLRKGKREARKHGRPCLSAKGLREEMIKYGRNQFDMGNVEIFSVTPTDGYVNICQCELCKPKSKPDRGRKGHMSDYVWNYAKEIATALYKTHPDKKVQCNSYNSYTLPPARIEKLPPNMTVMFQQNRYRFGDSEQRKRCLDLRKAYLEKLPGDKPLSNHDNYSQMGRSPFPMYIPRSIAEDMRSLKGISYGDYIEDNVRAKRGVKAPLKYAINHLNVYVTARCWWDADLDIDALLEEYYEKFYGPAAKEMKAFIEFSEANWAEMKNNVKLIDKTLELLNNALNAVDENTIYGKRVKLVDKYLYKLRSLKDKYAMNRKDNWRCRIYRAGNVKLDGILDERVWQFGVGRRFNKADKKRESWYRTGWKRDNLYFALHCKVQDMKILDDAAVKNDDPAILEDDRVEILLETQNHRFYQIVINSAGAIYDADWKDGSNPEWNSEAEVAIHKGKDFWNAEIMIPVAGEMQEENLPLRMVSGRKPNMVETWFFKIARFNEGKKADPEFHDPKKFAIFYME